MPARILLVDDEEIVLRAWTKALKATGHKLIPARTAEEAIHAAGNEPIDLVVVDYLLGAVTGVEVVNSIRKKRPLIRSILISAQIDENLKDSDLRELIKDKVEVDLYLHKPVRNKELRQAVSTLIESEKRPVEWQKWAEKEKAARAVKPDDGADAANRIKPFLKRK